MGKMHAQWRFGCELFFVRRSACDFRGSIQDFYQQTHVIAMISFWYWRLLLLSCSFFLCLTPSVLAGSGKQEEVGTNYKWFVTLYGGPHAQDNLGDVLSLQATFPDDTYIAVVALARELWRYENLVSLEAEGQIGKHFGEMDHWEFNGLLTLRWHPFWWDKHVETSLAVGDGLSWATEIPEVEKEDDENAQELLNYMLIELTLGLPKYPQWDLVVRIHHRSGVFGLFGGVYGGANFLCGGVKYSF
jgi:hypothetical protein